MNLNFSGRRRGLLPRLVFGLCVVCLSGVLPSVPDACARDIPAYHGPVNDLAGVLGAQEVQALSDKITAYRRESGIEFGVLIVSDLGDASLEDYAHDVYNRWGIGAKESDKGALFLVALAEHKARIEVGYGLEAALTDLECGRIVGRNSSMAQAFRQGNYAAGVSAVIDGMIAGVAGDYEPPPATRSSGRQQSMLFFFVFAMIATSILRLFARARYIARGGYRRGSFGGSGGFGGFGGMSSGGSSSGGFSFGGGSSGGGGASGGW